MGNHTSDLLATSRRLDYTSHAGVQDRSKAAGHAGGPERAWLPEEVLAPLAADLVRGRISPSKVLARAWKRPSWRRVAEAICFQVPLQGVPFGRKCRWLGGHPRIWVSEPLRLDLCRGPSTKRQGLTRLKGAGASTQQCELPDESCTYSIRSSDIPH